MSYPYTNAADTTGSFDFHGYSRDGKGQTEEIRRFNRMTNFVSTFGAVVRVLADAAKGVSLMDGGPAPAWTDGETVFLNKSQLPKLDGIRSALMAWIGAVYHELGHILYTPRMDSTMWQKMRAISTSRHGIFQTWNLVEDQRQERLLVAQFPSLVNYLLVMVRDIVLGKASDLSTAWPYVVGRMYVPFDVRNTARTAFGADAAKLASLVGEYQRLADPAEADNVRALELIVEIHDLLGDNSQQGDGCGWQPIEEGDSQPAEADDEDYPTADGEDYPEDTPEGEGEGEGGGAESDDEGEESEDEGEGTGEGEESDEDGDPSDGEGQGEGESEGDEDGEGEGEGQGMDDTDAEGDDASGKGESTDSGDTSDDAGQGTSENGQPSDTQPEAPTLDDMIDDLNEAIEDALNSDEMQREMDRVEEAVDGSEALPIDNVLPVKAWREADSETLRQRSDVEDPFRDLAAAVAPGWHREVESGRLNVARYLTSTVFDFDTMFDRWNPGMEEETSLEVVVLLDISGSMSTEVYGPEERDANGRLVKAGVELGTRLEQASKAVWIIRHAVEAVNGKVHVLGYDDTVWQGPGPGEAPHPTKWEEFTYEGGTTPAPGVRASIDILDHSEASHKLLIVVSDGDWVPGQGAEAVRAVTEEGILTIGVAITNTPDKHIQLGCKYGATMADPSGMAPLFRDVVMEVMETFVG